MNIYAISALVNVITSIVLGLLILLADRRSLTNRTFAFFASSVAFWSYAYFTWQIQIDSGGALFWTRVLIAGAAFITPVYYHFCCYFLGIERQQRYGILAGYAFIAISLFVNQSSLYITGVQPIDGFSFWPVAGPLFTPFLVVWLGYAIWPVFLLHRALMQADPGRSAAIKYIIAGTIIGYAGGCTNYFLWYGIRVLPFGNVSATIYLALVAYAIMRHRLFNMKVIATELLIFALWLFLFIRLLLDASANSQFADGSLLLVSLFVGVLLIRSVDREVEQREKIEQLSNEKSEFMSFASHEIRNPITAMRGYASLISDGTTGEVNLATKDAAEKILVTGNQVLMLIAQFLDKSKLELGQLTFAKDTFDLGTCIEDIAGGFVPHASQKFLYIRTKIEFPNLKVTADRTKFMEVIGNLIDNSVKYTDKGGVTVTVEKHSGMGRVTISDTGVGIPKETIPHLFQKFSRADAKKMNLKGTGLGLYLAKQLIEGMGGRIWVESAGDGQGSQFIVELPAAE